MPPRIPSALPGLRCLFRLPKQPQQTSSISSTSPAAALKSFGTPSTSSANTTQSSLLNLDSASSSPTSSPSGTSSHDALSSIIRNSAGHRAARVQKKKENISEGLRARTTSDNYTRQLPRHWKTGDVYAPHDLSPAEMRKWKKGTPPKRDVMDLLGVNPLDLYKNFSVVSDFITPFGRIKHNRETGLRPVNQRKMAKTIRRAIGLGIHPSVYRHPMILLKESANAKGRLG
ncbi:ribosomal protein S18 [Coniochaeta sp. 2T2.1]|nr:ribosomal protein S18 [Coniochaeta sp. 2T2.1]